MIGSIYKFRERLASKQLCLGTGITLNDPAVIEALAPVVDFFWVDLEHNPIGIESLLSLLIAARAGGSPALVRVPSVDTAIIKRVLDSGAEGLIAPQVRSKKDVEQVVAACRYTPLGTRGWGPRRPSDYGRRSLANVVREANEQLFVVVQIENVDAIAEIDQIVRVPGLDSIAIGPFDLSASMGMLGQVNHPKVVEAIETAIAAAKNAGLYVGYGDEAKAENAVRSAKLGADWVQCGSDYAYLLQSATTIFDSVRKQMNA